MTPEQRATEAHRRLLAEAAEEQARSAAATARVKQEIGKLAESDRRRLIDTDQLSLAG